MTRLFILASIFVMILHVEGSELQTRFPQNLNFRRSTDFIIRKVEPKAKVAVDYSKSVYFYLYTQRAPIGEYLSLNELDRTSFNPKYPTKIILHGFQTNIESPFIQFMTHQLVFFTKCNVILVDWEKLGTIWNYFDAVGHMEAAALATSNMILELKTFYEMDFSSYHLIGFSLGAHVAGITGEMIKNQTGQFLPRITGLDPEGFLFEYLPIIPQSTMALSVENARFVDVIHTNIGLRGYMNPIGHADFYPNNGGPLQPGCEGSPFYEIECSHDRAAWFFGESITNDNFIAYRCDSWIDFVNGTYDYTNYERMGMYVKSKSRGTYCLYTNDQYPFARGYNNKL